MKMDSNKVREIFLGLLRISIGWIFFWPFLDKVFGLGFSTEAGSGWVDGVSPTEGFLSFGTSGPFSEIFQGLAGIAVVDLLFMFGLMMIGLCFLLGIGTRIAAYSGALMLILMWLALLPPEHNPFLDEHIIYGLAMLTLPYLNAGDYIGLGKWWKRLKFVKSNPWLI